LNDFIDDVIDYLDTGPSTLGLDHACVCIANGKRPSQLTLALLAAGCNEVFNDSFCSRTKKHVKGLTSCKRVPAGLMKSSNHPCVSLEDTALLFNRISQTNLLQ
jgi:hypothetical protein